MAKSIDYIAFRFAIFMLFLIWFNYLINSFIISGILALILVIIISYILKWAKTKHTAYYSYDKFYKQLAILGNAYTLELYMNANEITEKPIKENILIDGDKLIISNFRFSDISIEDISRAFRTALKHEKTEVIIICKGIARNAILLAESLPIKFQIIKGNAFFKLLKSKKMVPPLMEMKKTSLKNLSIKNLFDMVFARSNAKHFIFTGGILSIMIFFTPLKLYYLIMSSIAFILAIICLFYPSINDRFSK